MKTVLTRDPAAAAEFIRSGGIVAFPTETVYGLGANLFDPAAIEKIFAAKRRPQDNPLIAHIGDLSQLDEIAAEVPEHSRLLIERFFPGPLTLVLRKRDRVPAIATAGLDTIGVRMPGDGFAREFLKACGTPVAAPSANLSGRPSPTTWQAVREDLDGRVDCILQGEATRIGLESTVVDCTGDHPVILRPGSISLDEIRSVAADAGRIGEGSEGEGKSPGLRHKHYTPEAAVYLVSSASEAKDPSHAAFLGTEDPGERFAFSKEVGNAAEYAHELFEFFRECDRRGIKSIYCQRVPEDGIGTALMDRLRRAAQG